MGKQFHHVTWGISILYNGDSLYNGTSYSTNLLNIEHTETEQYKVNKLDQGPNSSN